MTLIIVGIAGVLICTAFFFGDQWGRDADRRDQHFRAVANAETQLEIAKHTRASQTSPGWIYVVLVVLIVGAVWKLAQLQHSNDSWDNSSNRWSDWPER